MGTPGHINRADEKKNPLETRMREAAKNDLCMLHATFLHRLVVTVPTW